MLSTLTRTTDTTHAADTHMPSAVIFDMDGVLIDSEPIWRDGFRYGVTRFMTEHGLPVPVLTDDELRHYEGGRVDQTLAALHLALTGHPISPDARTALTTKVVEHVSGLFRTNPTPIAASVQTLRDVAMLGIPVAIATSSAPAFLDTVLDVLDLAHLVSVRQSALVLANGKPHPEVYHRALAALGVAAHEAVAIEDSMTGLEASTRAGLATLWFTTQTDDVGHTGLNQRVVTTENPGYRARLTASPTVTANDLLNVWTTHTQPQHILAA